MFTATGTERPYFRQTKTVNYDIATKLTVLKLELMQTKLDQARDPQVKVNWQPPYTVNHL